MKSGLEQDAAANRAVDGSQFFKRHITVLGIDVDHYVADIIVGLQELRRYIDPVFWEYTVNSAQNARHIAVYV